MMSLSLLHGLLLLPCLATSLLQNKYYNVFSQHNIRQLEKSSCEQPPRSDCFLRMSTITFRGDASTNRLITLPPNANHPSKSFPEWLRHETSDIALLGTTEASRKSDSDGRILWEVPQPPINWFGTNIKFSLINRIERLHHERMVSVSIIDTKMLSSSVLLDGRRRPVDLLFPIIEKSSFSGGTILSWKPVDRSSWLLTANLQLTLNMPLSKFLLLPPGFNTVGSGIVTRTCASRLLGTLENLKDSYWQWASAQ